MALSHVASGAWVSGAAAVTPAVPTGTAAGDLVIITLVSKYDDASLGTAPSGWTDLGVAFNTGSTAGTDSGNLRMRAFFRVWQAGDSMPSLAPTPNNVSTTKASTYRLGTAGYVYVVQGAPLADSTAGSPLEVTSASLSLATDDFVHVDLVINGDVATWGTTTISATGTTFGTQATNTADLSTTAGTDLRMRAVRRPVTTPGSAQPVTVSTTLAGTITNAVGVALVLRVGEESNLKAGSATGSFAVAGFAPGSNLGEPVNLTAVGTGPTQITVSWTNRNSATGYDIERDGVVIVTDHPSTPYVDNGRQAATQYSYRVRSRRT